MKYLFYLIGIVFLFVILPVPHKETKVLSYATAKTTSSDKLKQSVESSPITSKAENTASGSITPTPTATPEPVFKRVKAITLPSQEEIAQKIREIFPEDPEVAVAVFRAESGLRVDAVNWNCYYTGKNGNTYSTSCQTEERGRAWSVDCGVAQLNFPGQVCPSESFQLDWNLYQAKSKYLARGWQPWYAHTYGSYKRFLVSQY